MPRSKQRLPVVRLTITSILFILLIFFSLVLDRIQAVKLSQNQSLAETGQILLAEYEHFAKEHRAADMTRFVHHVQDAHDSASEPFMVDLIKMYNRIPDARNTIPLLEYFGEYLATFKYQYPRGARNFDHVFNELLKGGHVKVYDGDALFEAIMELAGGAQYTRISSHYKGTTVGSHYGVDQIIGRKKVHVLAGRGRDAGGDFVWFQLEKSPFGKLTLDSLIDDLNHAVDYLAYRLTAKNIGPLGSSAFTEAAPLTLFESNRTQKEQ